MPNHETNNVVVIGKVENIEAFVAEAFIQPGQPYPDSPDEKNDKDFPVLYFDFIVPSPPNKEKGGCGMERVIDENGDAIHAETGEICWYEWNLKNWGTKWGAYSHDHYQLRYLDGGEGVYARVDLRFETAWSQPIPILAAIEERWKVTVHAVTQDEGGFPDVEYGDPYGQEVLSRQTTFEFEAWDSAVEKPAAVSE